MLRSLGWVLVVAGIAGLAGPGVLGPGLVALVTGVALLLTQYSWRDRPAEPRPAAHRAASFSLRRAVTPRARATPPRRSRPQRRGFPAGG